MPRARLTTATGTLPSGSGENVVLEDALVVVGLGGVDGPVAVGGVVAAGGDGAGRDEDLGARVEDGEARC
jgi:hypothetical protein